MTRTTRLVLAVFLFNLPSVRAADVKYFDRAIGKEVRLTGVVIEKESPEGITIKVRNKSQKIPALDIRDVQFSEEEFKPVDLLTYRVPFVKLERALDPKTPEKERLESAKEAPVKFAE